MGRLRGRILAELNGDYTTLQIVCVTDRSKSTASIFDTPQQSPPATGISRTPRVN